MNQELVQQLLGVGKIVLVIFGATSILGVMGFFTAYYAFPPNLSVEEVKDKGKINLESRLVVKNIGQLPAYNVIVDVTNMDFEMDDGRSASNINTNDCGIPIRKLASGEKTEISVLPHIGIPVGIGLQSCDYKFILKYQLRLPFYKTILEKHWYVELRNSGDEFTWQIAMQ